MILHFCRLETSRLEVQQRSHWAKLKILAELHFFLEALGEYPFPFLFQLLEAAHIPWLMMPFLHH